MQTLGVGVIGFGFMGRVHAHNYRSMPIFYDPVPVRTKLVGVADTEPERSRRRCEPSSLLKRDSLAM